jgi:hypothetical protein
MLRIPHCLDSRLIDGGEVVSLTHRPRSTAQKHFFLLLLVLISVRGWVHSFRMNWHMVEDIRNCLLAFLLPRFEVSRKLQT